MGVYTGGGDMSLAGVTLPCQTYKDNYRMFVLEVADASKTVS